ncbi:hypothetical protein K469DRAFT_548309, partial [Zopfia rhizophila CBS 207.26]
VVTALILNAVRITSIAPPKIFESGSTINTTLITGNYIQKVAGIAVAFGGASQYDNLLGYADLRSSTNIGPEKSIRTRMSLWKSRLRWIERWGRTESTIQRGLVFSLWGRVEG